MSDAAVPRFSPEAMEAIGRGRLFAGGRRHHDIVARLLPEGARWVDITAPVEAFVERVKSVAAQMLPDADGVSWSTHRSAGPTARGDAAVHIVVFASGDPLFYGIAATLQRLWPEAQLGVIAAPHSLQMLACRLLLPYHDMRVVSLTGRPWHELDRALIECAPLIGVLTDAVHTPAAIAARMAEYGYTDYVMHIGVSLGNEAREQVVTLTVEEACGRTFARPCCLILKGHAARRMYIPDTEFAHLVGRAGMMTKLPYRCLTLAAMELHRRAVMWDIGSCTGSVAIEARLQHPHLHVVAFEQRRECEGIIADNARRMGVPGMDVHIGNFIDIVTEHRESLGAQPDAIFVGGHGGRLGEIMRLCRDCMAADGCIVMNSVSDASREAWHAACAELGLRESHPIHVSIDAYNPITIMKATL